MWRRHREKRLLSHKEKKRSKNSFEDYVGLWKVVCHEYTAKKGGNDIDQSSNIEGTEFELDDTWGVTWRAPENIEESPLLSADQYRLIIQANYEEVTFYLPNSEKLEFKANLDDTKELLDLSFSGKFILHCKKMPMFDADANQPATLTLTEAYQDESFADLTLYSNAGHHFTVHRCIMHVAYPEIDWSMDPPPIPDVLRSGNVLSAIIHFAYHGTLQDENNDAQQGKSMEIARELLSALRLHSFDKANNFGFLKKFVENYLQKHGIRAKISSGIDDIEVRLNYMMRLLHGGNIPDDLESITHTHLSEPRKLMSTFKELMKESLLQLCALLVVVDGYSNRKKELCKSEKKQLYKLVASRGHVVLMTFVKFGELLQSHLKLLEANQIEELGQYLVNEIDFWLPACIRFATICQDAVERTVENAAQKEQKKKRKPVVKLKRLLKNTLHVKELLRLKEMQENLMSALVVLNQKSEEFASMSLQQKADHLDKILNEIINRQIPSKMKKLKDALEENDKKKTNFTFRDFTFLLNICIMYTRWALDKAREGKTYLEPLVKQLSELLHCREFDKQIDVLGLSTETPSTPRENDLTIHDRTENPPSSMNVGQFFAKEMLSLLDSKRYTDLEFIFGDDNGLEHRKKSINCVDCIKSALVPICSCTCYSLEHQNSTIMAHRIILSARCNWFKRALESGMRESIDRKFHIEDCTADIFRLFLTYVYTSKIDADNLSCEDLIELMTLADRYEVVALQKACELSLIKNHINYDTLLCLLSVAHNMSATQLKKAVLDRVPSIPDLTQMKDFQRLSPELQDEVLCKFEMQYYSESSNSSPILPFVDEFDSYRASQTSDDSDSSIDVAGDDAVSLPSSLSPQSSVGTSAIDECVENLRDILGNEVSADDLVRLSLAADGDVGRAANYYYEWGVPGNEQ